MANRSACACLLTTLLLPLCGSTSAGHDIHDGPPADGARLRVQPPLIGDFWTPEELRRVEPPGSFAPMPPMPRTLRFRPSKIRSNTLTPNELHRVQPDVGDLPMPNERRLNRP